MEYFDVDIHQREKKIKPLEQRRKSNYSSQK
jgi:hypothetical protein